MTEENFMKEKDLEKALEMWNVCKQEPRLVCPSCDVVIDGDSDFCSNCGKKIPKYLKVEYKKRFLKWKNNFPSVITNV